MQGGAVGLRNNVSVPEDFAKGTAKVHRNSTRTAGLVIVYVATVSNTNLCILGYEEKNHTLYLFLHTWEPPDHTLCINLKPEYSVGRLRRFADRVQFHPTVCKGKEKKKCKNYGYCTRRTDGNQEQCPKNLVVLEKGCKKSKKCVCCAGKLPEFLFL